MRDKLSEGKSDEARVAAGASNAYSNMRNTILTYEREEEQNAFIQEQTR